MKTQLLEDIGESAALSPPFSKPAGNSNAGKGVAALAPARNAAPARARAATGVWRQKLVGELPATTTAPPEEATPLELDKVFGEIAALEAQFVRPEPEQAPAASAGESTYQPGIASAEPMLAPEPSSTTTTPQDPFFDFTPPAPAPHLADPFTPAPAVPARSRKRPLVWAACALSAALLAWGGRYLVQERKDAESLALIASQAKGGARVDSASPEPALAARASKARADAGALLPSTVPAITRLPDVPPLVMLEPDPPAAIKPEPAPRLGAGRSAPVTAPKTVRAAKQAPATSQRKPSVRKTRERPDPPARPAKERPEREPVRRFARASAAGAEGPSMPGNAMAATLKACREHGYHASQCIKRQCSVGTYGFACRGR
jgi:hypothetical protein